MEAASCQEAEIKKIKKRNITEKHAALLPKKMKYRSTDSMLLMETHVYSFVIW